MSAPQSDRRPLEAGRELDALVAERVMGLEPVHYPGGAYYDAPGVRGHYRMPGLIVTIPPYSTEIAAAWEVLERFQIRHINLAGPHAYSGQLYHVSVGSGQATAETAPLAICLAALNTCDA